MKSIGNILNEHDLSSEHIQSQPKRIKSDKSGAKRVVPGYLVDYVESNTKTTTEPKPISDHMSNFAHYGTKIRRKRDYNFKAEIWNKKTRKTIEDRR